MTTRTRLMEDPVYVEAFVSRMMSKHPLKDENSVSGLSGISLGANLGYEPYWINLFETPWKDKCGRCPELFKRYKTVCAMDSTGEVLVNITMCKLLQMNCLAGTVEGQTMGKYGDWENKNDYFVVQDGWARFSVRMDRDLVVQLSYTPDRQYPNYEMIIDGWDGYWSVLYKNGRNIQQIRHWYRTLPGKEKWAEFMILWNNTSGWLLMTRITTPDKIWTQNNVFYFNVTDYYPFPIKYIAISGVNGYKGDWIINGFVVNQLAPCRDHRPGMARLLTTNPTHEPYIFSRVSPVNVDFFSGVDHESLQQGNATHFGNVSFLTREEY